MPILVITTPILVITMVRSWRSRCSDPRDHDGPKSAYSNSLVVAFGMSERGYEAIVAIAIFPRWVRLYFDKSLPDPKGLLEGSGAKVRSVTLKAASDLDHGDIQALLKAAIKHSGVTFPRTRSTRMIIKSESKKRRPRRTGHA